ncbi:hypothetical protein QBC47DRAFT_361125 [Echria macrotheca]|uniref:Uncharacterized protein n=1 Tax=Echria macrotheca TaxID=438768 RepID=A0AAJ0BB97_9PEZI|nr:hypothetical protein QBC47DRAFT_361125 [Echria macrotheca]
MTDTEYIPVWFITAASSGFGRAIALEALRRGHKVIASARSTSRLTDVKAAGAAVMELDVTADDATLSSKFSAAQAIYGRLTHVVNPAGYILEGAIEEATAQEVFEQFNTNVLGTFNIARAAAPFLREAAASQPKDHKPVLANFGSLGSWRSGPASAHYCSTKFAVSGMTEGLRDELAPFGVDVTVIEPGYTRTGFLVRDGDGPEHRIQTARTLAVYDGTGVAATRDAMVAYNGQQPGNVEKCARVIVDVLTKEGVASGREIPMRLPLGTDTLDVVRGKCDETLKLLKDWEEVASSVMTADPPPEIPSRDTPPSARIPLSISTPMPPSPTLGPSTGPPGASSDNLGAIPTRLKSPDTASVRSGQSQSHRDYFDSLVPPSRDEFEHIAEIQAEREAQIKRRSRELQRQSVGSTPEVEDGASEPPKSPGRRVLARLGFHGHGRKPSADERAEAKAATVIQRTYRGYRVRREMKGLGIDATTRWIHAVREAQWRELNRPRARSPGGGSNWDLSTTTLPGEQVLGSNESGMLSPDRRSTAKSNWRKAATIARRAGADVDASSDSSSISSASSTSSSDSDEKRRSKQAQKQAQKQREEAKERRRKEAKMMGLQYFLEMVDLKHRYGSNLRVYHEEWKKADTNENFFYWLDYGEGRNVSVDACPREQLDREQVRYLSREERQYYLVKVDEVGRLCWAKNGARIDTTEAFKDSIHGIVPADDETPAYRPMEENETRLLGDSSTGTSSSTDSDEGDRYATLSFDEAKGVNKIKHISATTVFNKLLRKSVRKNTWIFVADTSFRLYVGIKNSGAFQHSSFLQGSRISAAGLIKIKDGRLRSLSPLSGHYRPPASNFRAFVRSLKEEGVDMSRVSISKSYAVLVGLEAYVKVRKKGQDAVRKMAKGKQKVVAPDEYRQKKEEGQDRSESAAKERELMEAEEATRENAIGVSVMQKLGVPLREPKGQKGEDEREAAVAAHHAEHE